MEKKKIISYLVLFIFLVLFGVGVFVVKTSDDKMHLIACDVGQGDAILIVYKTSEILIDGGPNNKVLDCLGKYLPFWDRTIEMVVLTHPDTDHFRGLSEVFKRYKVQLFLANSIETGNQEYRVLENIVRGKGVRVINPSDNSKLRLGLIYLDILWPSENYLKENLIKISGKSSQEKLGTSETKLANNEFSIVTKLNFRKFNALLTGDVPKKNFGSFLVSKELGSVNYIKIPHHGSKSGIDQNIIGLIKPQVGVISAGINNSYGLPNAEILELLKSENIKLYRTDLDGDVELMTDGEKYWFN